VLVVSLLLATGTPLVWELTTPPANAGEVPTVRATPLQWSTAYAADPAGTAPEAEAEAEAGSARVAGIEGETDVAARDARDAVEVGPRPATRSARIADLEVTSSAAPRRLRIPSIAVDAKIGAIGVEASGELEVPENVRNVGWYRYGPAPGEPGATVIAGHVDSREQGPGAFFDLRSLDVGARVQVTDSDGDVQRYDVVARRTYDKAKLPTDELFSREGPPQLVLITCGGDFDSSARSYRENVVIYAQPS
jgi:sortase (surface protein transpeptidase)